MNKDYMSVVEQIVRDIFQPLQWLVPGSKPSKPDANLAEAIAHGFNGTILNKADHPKFMADINEMSKAAGLNYEPIVMVSEDLPCVPPFMSKLSNAVGIPEQGIIITNDAMLDLMKSSKQEMTGGLKSFMAHEISHLKYDEYVIKLGRLSPVMLAAAGMGALYYVNHAGKKHPKDEDVSARQEHIKQLADEHLTALDEEEKSNKPGPKAETKIYKPLVTAASYLGIAALGIAAGLQVNRQLLIAAEYRADRTAVKLAKDPEAFIKAFKDIEHETFKFIGSVVDQPDEVLKVLPETKLEREYLRIQNDYLMAHPSNKLRIQEIRKTAQNLGIE